MGPMCSASVKTDARPLCYAAGALMVPSAKWSFDALWEMFTLSFQLFVVCNTALWVKDHHFKSIF